MMQKRVSLTLSGVEALTIVRMMLTIERARMLQVERGCQDVPADWSFGQVVITCVARLALQELAHACEGEIGRGP